MADSQEETGFDMEAAVDSIGADLGLGNDDHVDEHVEEPVDEPTESASESSEETTQEDAPTEPAQPVAKAPPQSWAKEKHELWAKLPPEAQEYYEIREKQMLDGLEQYKEHAGFGKQMREVMQPYKAFLTAQGVDEPRAAQYLLNAHYKLSNGTPEEKRGYFANLAKSYGIDLAGLQAEQPQVDPHMKSLQDKVQTLESTLTQQRQAEINQQRAKVTAEIEAFASDPKHPYFDECADEIAALVQAGHPLETAYEKAVYANPVTRAKELSRLQAEKDKSLREKSKLEVETARRAASTNVRSRDTRKAPTEPKGKMFDDMPDLLKEIRDRVH